MRLTLGQLRSHLLVELKRQNDNEYVVDADDLESALKDRPQPDAAIRGESLYVPLRYKDRWDAPRFSGDLQRHALFTKLSITPKQLLSTLKRELAVDGITFRASEQARASIMARMARRIARRFTDEVNVVTYPESSSNMARDLANMVSEELGLGPAVGGMTRKKTGHEVEIDPTEWKNFEAQSRAEGRTDEWLAGAKKKAESLIKRWKKTGQAPATKDIPHSVRKLLPLHTGGEGLQQAQGKRVLVVDDNVDKAETLRSVAKTLRAAGAGEVFLAAGWDYSDR